MHYLNMYIYITSVAQSTLSIRIPFVCKGSPGSLLLALIRFRSIGDYLKEDMQCST